MGNSSSLDASTTDERSHEVIDCASKDCHDKQPGGSNYHDPSQPQTSSESKGGLSQDTEIALIDFKDACRDEGFNTDCQECDEIKADQEDDPQGDDDDGK